MSTEVKKSNSLLKAALLKIVSEKVSLIALIIVAIYFGTALLTSLNLVASTWNTSIGASYLAPGADALFGTDIFGRSVATRVIKATETAVAIGVVVSIIAIVIGTTLGMLAGYFGGIIDEIIVWFYTTSCGFIQHFLLFQASCFWLQSLSFWGKEPQQSFFHLV